MAANEQNEQEELKLPEWWYQPQYQEQMDSLAQQIENRPAFRFRVDQEALYDYYKGEYDRQGREAKADTQARGAALTGGYDNSYARQAGKEAYEGYMDSLQENVVPELQEMALDKYNQDGQALVDRYSSLQKQEEQAYKQWQEVYKEQIKAWEEEQAEIPEETPVETEVTGSKQWAPWEDTPTEEELNTGMMAWIAETVQNYENGMITQEEFDNFVANLPNTYQYGMNVEQSNERNESDTFDTLLENGGYGVTNYPKAVSRLRNMGVSQEVMQGLLTEAEWIHLRDEALAASEADDSEINIAAAFNTYLEYLRFYVVAAEYGRNAGISDYSGNYYTSMGKSDGMGVTAGVS